MPAIPIFATALAPPAREVLTFFDQHSARGADGKLRLEPSQALETWWVTVNPTPDVAGLQYCLDGLLALSAGSQEDQAHWRRFRGEIPELFLPTSEGRQTIAPARKWERQSNMENAELYAVFPFRCFGLALGSGDLVAWTMKHRTVKDGFGSACWTQDQIQWAYAGNATEAAHGLVRRFRVASPLCRFPLFGREGPDSCPDFDHFGAGSIALQRMLVQEAGAKILLLPAWPADWDVEFKLHLSQRAILTGAVKAGRLTTWDIHPASRKKDVVVCEPQPNKPLGPVIPANHHALRAGSDQTGANKLKGGIGRVTFFREKLKPETIREFAASDRTKSLDSSWLNPNAGDILPTKPEDFAGAISFEAWICPSENETGRILDKLTAGKNDGFLWDTYPGLSLRVIAGDQIKIVNDTLKPGIWQHVAVVIDRGVLRLYVNGQPLD